MEWNKLLTSVSPGEKTKENILLEGRSQFQRDFDRIVFSSAFRRLQDKTQVFPMPENDFVHTRLTHSLEVSCVGRSLGNKVGQKILEKHSELNNNFTKYHFGEIVASACLAHDIGNPPFGHSGEDAISEYFRKGNGKIFEKELNDPKKWNDFTWFEGNAQGFRIITKIQNPGVQGGLRLTYATLAAFTKYPKESFTPEFSNKVINNKIFKKYGFFQSEKEIFTDISEKTGLIFKGNKNELCWYRHPLAFLVEAADDITYRIMDLEDGFRLGLLSFKETEDLLFELIKKDELKGYEEREKNDKISYLRAKAINNLVNQVSEAFLEKEDEIMKGNFIYELISVIENYKALETIKNISVEKIYSIDSVLEREAAGYEVLGGLLDIFINAVNDVHKGKPPFRSKSIIKLLPIQFLGVNRKTEDDLYFRLLKITDYVSGMTDSYAVSLYRRIKGISLPGK